MTYPLMQHSTSCATAVPLLEAFLDGELGPEQTILVEAHLESCAECDEHARFLLSLSQSVCRAVHDEVEVKPEFLARLNRAVEAEVERESLQRSASVSPWPTRAAAVAAAASITVWFSVQEQGLLSGSSDDRASVNEAQTLGASVGGTMGGAVGADTVLTFEGALDRLIDYHSSPPKPDVTNPALLPKYEADVGVRLQLPRLDKYGATWEGANLVPVNNHRAASLRYHVAGHRVTLYVFNASKVRVREHANRGSGIDNPVYVGTWRGYTVAAKEHFGTGYAIAGDMDDAAITEMMTAVH